MTPMTETPDSGNDDGEAAARSYSAWMGVSVWVLTQSPAGPFQQ